MAAPLREVVEQFGDHAAFTAVFPNRKSDEISIRAFLGRYELKGFEPVLDPDQKITRRLGATVTPEVVVTDAAERILYRGRISDAYSSPGRVRHGKSNNNLARVMSKLVNGEEATRPWPEAVGCFITFFGTAP
ncbi:hypothetical protein CEQ90_15815 [Lewinellaceae bacterium SD302]|nr:hypothetical protein CEQ90_15815 [Lewinellaceae bacterium SD302]